MYFYNITQRKRVKKKEISIMSKVYKKNLNIGPNLLKKFISGQKRKK